MALCSLMAFLCIRSSKIEEKLEFTAVATTDSISFKWPSVSSVPYTCLLEQNGRNVARRKSEVGDHIHSLELRGLSANQEYELVVSLDGHSQSATFKTLSHRLLKGVFVSLLGQNLYFDYATNCKSVSISVCNEDGSDCEEQASCPGKGEYVFTLKKTPPKKSNLRWQLSSGQSILAGGLIRSEFVPIHPLYLSRKDWNMPLCGPLWSGENVLYSSQSGSISQLALSRADDENSFSTNTIVPRVIFSPAEQKSGREVSLSAITLCPDDELFCLFSPSYSSLRAILMKVNTGVVKWTKPIETFVVTATSRMSRLFGNDVIAQVRQPGIGSGLLSYSLKDKKVNWCSIVKKADLIGTLKHSPVSGRGQFTGPIHTPDLWEFETDMLSLGEHVFTVVSVALEPDSNLHYRALLRGSPLKRRVEPIFIFASRARKYQQLIAAGAKLWFSGTEHLYSCTEDGQVAIIALKTLFPGLSSGYLCSPVVALGNKLFFTRSEPTNDGLMGLKRAQVVLSSIEFLSNGTVRAKRYQPALFTETNDFPGHVSKMSIKGNKLVGGTARHLFAVDLRHENCGFFVLEPFFNFCNMSFDHDKVQVAMTRGGEIYVLPYELLLRHNSRKLRVALNRAVNLNDK